MYRPDHDKMVICPYDSRHIVSKLRIQKHIMKCQKNNPDIKLVSCFYNFSHKLKPEELLSHYEICTHKTRLDSAQYVEPVVRATSNFAKRNYLQSSFPDINSRTKFFSGSSYPCSKDNRSEISDYCLSSSESETVQLKALKETVLKTEFYNAESDGSDDNDNLEPLPLPKTVSKAFVISKQQANESSSEAAKEYSQSKLTKFYRGNHLESSQFKKPITNYHLPPDINETDDDVTLRRTHSNFSLKDSFSNFSAFSTFRSLKIDDESTIKSEEIFYDEDFD